VSQSLVAVLFGDPFAVMNTIGLVAFALVGASKAIREEFDLLGIVGVAMAFAGGTTPGTAAAACAVVTVGTRLAAVAYGWNLPTAQNLDLQRE